MYSILANVDCIHCDEARLLFVLFQPAESYDVASMKQEVQDAKIVRARYSRRPPCLAASNAANNSEASNDMCPIFA